MALEFSSKVILSTDKRYLFLEDESNESDGYRDIVDLFTEYYNEGLQYYLGHDTDIRFLLTPIQLLTFNTETETETEN